MPFKKGQSGNVKGKPKGAKGKKTEQWEAIGESITGKHAEKVLMLLWMSCGRVIMLKKDGCS